METPVLSQCSEIEKTLFKSIKQSYLQDNQYKPNKHIDKQSLQMLAKFHLFLVVTNIDMRVITQK